MNDPVAATMPCPACRGQGDTHGQRCSRCGGSGDLPATDEYLAEMGLAPVAASMLLSDLLATVPPGHREEPWTWEDEERDIRDRLCLCCGKPGHHQETVEAMIAAHGLTEGVCIGDDGRLHDGHHRVVAAMHLGLERVPLEPKGEADSRWQRDHGGTMWELRRFGDVHPGEAWAYVQSVRQQAREFVASEEARLVAA